MPNYFTIRKKGVKENSAFTDIDNELCEMLGIEPDPEYYVHGWYDFFGMLIACGTDLGTEKFKIFLNKLPEGKIKKIGEYLNEHFENNAWYQAKCML